MTAYVYALHAWDGSLLYIGSTSNAFARVGQHSVSKPWWDLVARVVVTPYEDREAAYAAEAWSIAARHPLHNRVRPTPPGKSAPYPIDADTTWSVPGPHAQSPTSLVTAAWEAREHPTPPTDARSIRDEQDSAVLQDLVERLLLETPADGFRWHGGEIYARYVEAAKGAGIAPSSRRAVFAALGSHGWYRRKSNRGVVLIAPLSLN